MRAPVCVFQSFLLLVASGNARFENMNGEYLIGNPNQSAKQFSTKYTDRVGVDYFDVYSDPIRTK